MKTQAENTGFAACNIAARGNTGFSAAIDTEEENPDIKTDSLLLFHVNLERKTLVQLSTGRMSLVHCMRLYAQRNSVKMRLFPDRYTFRTCSTYMISTWLFATSVVSDIEFLQKSYMLFNLSL